jgi:hypothetical protein
MSYDAWDRLAGLVHDESGGLDLPGRIRGRLRGQVLQLGPVKTGRADKDDAK